MGEAVSPLHPSPAASESLQNGVTCSVGASYLHATSYRATSAENENAGVRDGKDGTGKMGRELGHGQRGAAPREPNAYRRPPTRREVPAHVRVGIAIPVPEEALRSMASRSRCRPVLATREAFSSSE